MHKLQDYDNLAHQASNGLQLCHVMRKPVFAICNNKGADQPAHPRSLISAFVVRCLDSIILILATDES